MNNFTDGAPGQENFQPTSFRFDAQSDAEIAKILVKYPPGRQASAVLPLLYIVQAQLRRETESAWVPRLAMDAVAARLGMPPIRVYEVATFYLMFNTAPVGKFHLQICTTTPCWLRGSDAVVGACRDVTGIQGWHETSADGLFTMTEVECLGACCNAPMIQINDAFYEDLDAASTIALLEALKRGETPPPGSALGRKGSEPLGGLTSLTDPALPGLGG